MYPAKAPFQLLKQSQKSLFIFTLVRRRNNSRAGKLVSTSCPHSDRRPLPTSGVLVGELTCVLPHSNPSSTVLFRHKVATHVQCCFLRASDYKATKANNTALPLDTASLYNTPPYGNRSSGREVQSPHTSLALWLLFLWAVETSKWNGNQEYRQPSVISLLIQVALQSNPTPVGRLREKEMRSVCGSERWAQRKRCWWVYICNIIKQHTGVSSFYKVLRFLCDVQ